MKRATVFLEGQKVTHQPPLRFDEGSVDAVHLVVQSAGVAQVVARTVPPPEGRRHGPAVHTLPPLGKVIKQVWREREIKFEFPCGIKS